MGSETDYGAGLFNEADFSMLAARLRAISGRFVLSINDTPATRRIFAGFVVDQVELTYRLVSMAGKARRRES